MAANFDLKCVIRISNQVVTRVSFQIMIQHKINITIRSKIYSCSELSDKLTPVKYSTKFNIQKSQDDLYDYNFNVLNKNNYAENTNYLAGCTCTARGTSTLARIISIPLLG